MKMMMLLLLSFAIRRTAAKTKIYNDDFCVGNRGVFYAEDQVLGLDSVCECNQCYYGKRCELLKENCTVDATTVEMTFAREFFEAQSEIDVSSQYHLDYLDNPSWLYGSSRNRISSALNNTIRKLHDTVGNLPEGSSSYQLVVGAGAMQLLTASVASLAKISNTSSCNLAVQRPYWAEFKDIATTLSPRVQ
jgi:hypothetical protein